MSPFLSAFLTSLVAVLILFAITFAIGVAQQRFAVIDVAWGLGFVVVAWAAYLVTLGEGDPLLRLLLLAGTTIWGLRLAGFLAWRLRGKGDDPRYVAMLAKAKEGKRNTYALLRVYLPQVVILLFVSLVQQVGMIATGQIEWIAWLGAAVWLVGLVFESIGDWQLARFKNDPAKKGTILDSGLWAWTRHPNYFGDTAIWWGLFLITASAWPGVLTVLSPALMTWALAARTGKPLTEKGMMDRPGYREYMERTSGFFPLPPKRG